MKSSRRQFLQFVSVGAAGMALAACGAPATEAAPAAPTTAPAAAQPEATQAPAEPTPTTAPAAASEAITLSVFNMNWGEVYNNALMKISDEFTKDNPNIKVEWQFIPSQDFTTKLTTLMASGTPPDTHYTNFFNQSNFAAQGSLIAMDDLFKAAGLKREDFIVAMYDAANWNGKEYACPGGADYMCNFYSKDVFKDVGLDPEKPPTTEDELIDISKKVLKKESNGDISRIGYIPNVDEYQHFVFINGGRWYDPGTKKITANEQINIDTLQWLADYYKMLDVDKVAAFKTRPDNYSAGNPFSTKQSTFAIDGFWFYDALNQFAPDLNYGVSFVPTKTGKEEDHKNYRVAGWFYAIPKDSKQPDPAWKFIQYCFINNAAKMGYLTLNGPCVKAQLPDFLKGVTDLVGAKDRIAPYLNIFTKMGEVAEHYWPAIPVNTYYNDEVTRIFDFVVRGKMTAQAALDEVTKNVQAELDKALAGG
jgi:multiple sugar transport system substrate-binding protein